MSSSFRRSAAYDFEINCLYWDLVECRVGIELRSVFKREFLRFDKSVNMISAAKSEHSKVERLQYVEDLQCRYPLPVGWQLPNVEASVVGRYGFDPFRFVIR